jgi:hypothetical protein
MTGSSPGSTWRVDCSSFFGLPEMGVLSTLPIFSYLFIPESCIGQTFEWHIEGPLALLMVPTLLRHREGRQHPDLFGLLP